MVLNSTWHVNCPAGHGIEATALAELHDYDLVGLGARWGSSQTRNGGVTNSRYITVLSSDCFCVTQASAPRHDVGGTDQHIDDLGLLSQRNTYTSYQLCKAYPGDDETIAPSNVVQRVSRDQLDIVYRGHEYTNFRTIWQLHHLSPARDVNLECFLLLFNRAWCVYLTDGIFGC